MSNEQTIVQIEAAALDLSTQFFPLRALHPTGAPDQTQIFENAIEQALISRGDAIKNSEQAVIELKTGGFEVVSAQAAMQLRNERQIDQSVHPIELAKAAKDILGFLPAQVREEAVVLSTGSGVDFAEDLVNLLELPRGVATRNRFKNSETGYRVETNVRNKDVFLVTTLAQPVNEHLMETFLALDAIKRACPRSLTVIAPFFAYGRQDRRTSGREPISAKLVAKFLEQAGAGTVMTVDIHAEQVTGFFDQATCENLHAAKVLIPYLKRRLEGQELVVVSPDAGGTKRIRPYARQLGAGLAMMDKFRSKANEVEEMTLIGDVRGKVAILIDDMIDTGGTLIEAARIIKQNGATSVIAVATHAVFSGDAVAKLEASELSEVIVTDTLPLRRARGDFIQVVPVAPLVAEAMRRALTGESVQELRLS